MLRKRRLTHARPSWRRSGPRRLLLWRPSLGRRLFYDRRLPSSPATTRQEEDASKEHKCAGGESEYPFLAYRAGRLHRTSSLLRLVTKQRIVAPYVGKRNRISYVGGATVKRHILQQSLLPGVSLLPLRATPSSNRTNMLYGYSAGEKRLVTPKGLESPISDVLGHPYPRPSLVRWAMRATRLHSSGRGDPVQG